MRRVSANAFEFNKRSIRIQEFAGFKREGVKRKAVFKNGEYHDVILLGMLREEWEEKRKKKG